MSVVPCVRPVTPMVSGISAALDMNDEGCGFRLYIDCRCRGEGVGIGIQWEISML